jgi:hypothetical protein
MNIKSIFDKFYKDNEIKFDENIHAYRINGDLFTGVTTICSIKQKDFLAPWASKENWKYLTENWDNSRLYTDEEKEALLLAGKNAWTNKSKKAKDSGTLAHEYISAYILGKKLTMPDDPEALNAIKAFMTWETENKPKWIASEKIVASLKNKVAGTLDTLCEINGKLTLLDLKTSGQMSDDHILQQAGYLICLEEMGLKVEETRILRIPKDGTDAELSPNINGEIMKFAKETFLHLRQAHRWNLFVKNQLSDENGKLALKEA